MRTLILLVLLITMIPATVQASEDTYLSTEIQEACIKYGNEYGICPELLMAIIERESSGNPNATNGTCKGLMQISDKWHRDRMNDLNITDIYSIDGNIHLGTDYLMELAEQYGDVATCLMVYHGEKNALANSEKGIISNYAEWILERSSELERIHGK